MREPEEARWANRLAASLCLVRACKFEKTRENLAQWAHGTQIAVQPRLRCIATRLELRKTDPVLRATGRAELTADVAGNVLAARRALGNERRSLFLYLGSTACSLHELAARSQLRACRALMQTSTNGSLLAPREAAIVAGQGTLPKPGKATV